VFTYLRLKKRNGLLVLLSLALMIVSVLVAYFLMPLAGISANGIGILAANSLVVVISAVFWRKMNSPIQPGKGV